MLIFGTDIVMVLMAIWASNLKLVDRPAQLLSQIFIVNMDYQPPG